jgi:hypothetical protein
MNGPKKFIPSRPVHGGAGEPPIDMVEAPMPKVAICLPSGDMVHKDHLMGVVGLTAFSTSTRDGMQPLPVTVIDTRGSLIVRNRNLCVEHAQQMGMDYVLFIDSDVKVPRQALRQLLSWQKDIVGAAYVQRDPPHHLLGVWDPQLQMTTDRLHEVVALPAGCLMVKMSVFDKMVKPYFRTPAFEAIGDQQDHTQGEDYYFCERARELGYSIWLDPVLTCQIEHVGLARHRVPMAPAPEPEVNPLLGTEAANGQAVH